MSQVVGGAQVQSDRELVPVHRLEVRGLPIAVEGRTPRPCVISAAGPFHLDHGCAEICEQHRGVRSGEHAREVRDEYAVEGTGHVEAPCVFNSC